MKEKERLFYSRATETGNIDQLSCSIVHNGLVGQGIAAYMAYLLELLTAEVVNAGEKL